MALDIWPAGTKLSASQHRHMHGRLTEVRYAHPEGDNSNDGMTWGTAKEDVGSAYDVLPAEGGTIYFGNGTYVDAADAEHGLWIGPGGTGWRTQKRLRLVGVGNEHAGLGHSTQAVLNGYSATDRSKPVIWLNGTSVPMEFENVLIRYPAVAVRIGIDDDMVTFNGASG